MDTTEHKRETGIILGAGPVGLYAAFILLNQGLDVVMYEPRQNFMERNQIIQINTQQSLVNTLALKIAGSLCIPLSTRILQRSPVLGTPTTLILFGGRGLAGRTMILVRRDSHLSKRPEKEKKSSQGLPR